jgi:FkbM family methyltransferase
MAIKVHHLKYSRAMAKAVIPKVGRLICGKHTQNALSFIEIGAQILQGKGSGTGWDFAAEFKAASGYIEKGAIIFDVGANKGEWTKAVLTLDPEIVYMFEPQQSCVEKYLRPMESGCCKVVDVAVGDREGDIDFYSPQEDAGNSSIYNRRDTCFAGQDFQRSKVRISTLDAFIEKMKIPRVDFLKIDVEGHELFVLKGAKNSIRDRLIRAISFEFGSAGVYSRVFFRDIWDFLTAHDYKIYRILPGGSLVQIDSYYEDLEHFRGVSNYVAALDRG